MAVTPRIAIVGIGGVFPGASDIEAFWGNILAGHDCATEPPRGRWLLPADDAYSPEIAPDKVNSRRACVVEDFQLDLHGIELDASLRNVLPGLDPVFHFLLHAGTEAWASAKTDQCDRSRVGVIIGNIALPTDASSAIADELLGAAFDKAVAEKLGLGNDSINSSPNSSTNVKTSPLNRNVAGLPASILAHALQLGGDAYTLDAACASSLYALKRACDELIAGRADVMLSGGLSRPDSLYTQMGFSQLHAISPSGRCSPFDQKGDGLVVGEGCGMVVLKRIDDALRDGDHIHATIAGIGLSNDIEGNLMLPASEGQLRAMRQAYRHADWSPLDVQHIECHGTGTPTGDAVELESLRSLWADSDPEKQAARAVIGSVKSNIGHLLTAAGSAGLIKTLLAIRDGVLPPTANFSNAIEGQGFADGTFEVLAKPREWQALGDVPRRAAISAFGFGGINAHVLLEEWNERVGAGTGKGVRVSSPSPVERDAEPIAIVGLDIAVGPWNTASKFAAPFATNGRSSGDRVPTAPNRWWGHVNTDQYRGHFMDSVKVPLGRFRIPPNELAAMLPQQLLMLQMAANALDDAGIPNATSHVKSGVFIGIDLDPNTTNFHFRWSMQGRIARWMQAIGLSLDTQDIEYWIQQWRDASGPPLTADRTMGNLGGIVASRVARAFRVGGPSHTISSEELSGLHALKVAVDSLQQSEIDTAIVGAVDLAGDLRSAISYGEQCRDGGRHHDIAFADGAAALILKRLSDAQRDGDHVHAVIDQISDQAFGEQRDGTATAKAASPTPWGFAGAAHEFLRFVAGVIGVPDGQVSRDSSGDQIRFTGSNSTGSKVEVVMHKEDVEGSKKAPSAHPWQENRHLEVPVGGLSFDPPVPNLPATPMPAPPKTATPSSPASSPPSTLTPQEPSTESPMNVPTPLIEQAGLMVTNAAAVEVASVETQSAFLRQADLAASLVAEASAFLSTLGSGAIAIAPPATAIATAPENAPTLPPVTAQTVALDREQCLEFAIGSIGRVLGESFAEIDSYPTRVRLPDEPLMLADRILEIEGEAGSLTHGRVVTEHDIHPGAWYLDGGRIPTCIAVEAGQADLFLSGYLGIDFRTKGLAVYRLLDAVVTFHDALPGEGKTIHYDIRISEFFQQGDTYLFRFEFDATVDGRPLLTMRRGCAGFFSQEELNAGKGVVKTTIDTQVLEGTIPSDWQTLAPMPIAGQTEAYTDGQVDALRRGDLVTAFGDKFTGLGLQDPVKIPSGRMTLVHRILKLDPQGGRFGIGQIVGEADVHPDDWFLTCHFIDDKVMPGTLMYECCLHTLRVYLMRMGWVGEADEIVYEPIPDESSQLKCRGQVLDTTKKVLYELTLKEVGYDDDGTPFVLADALMYGDGKPIVQMKNMSVRLSGLTRDRVESLWRERSETLPIQVDSQSEKQPAIFDFDSIYAFGNGKPSDAFGDRYKVFDNDRRIARLPRPPYQYLDRITSIKDCEQWKLATGGVIEGQYDVPSDAWYFDANRQPEMPFAVLLEVALQPCGWLAAYLGSALTSDTDLSFRNLGGSATQFLPVTRDTGTLTTRIKITGVSQSAGMIIQHYDLQMRSAQGEVYQGSTYFGFFSADSLADQVGIRDADTYQPTAEEIARAEVFAIPAGPSFPDAIWRMVETVDHYDPAGGPHGLGFIRGSTAVHADAWFFQAHFYQDPVWPGSLGLESFYQLLKVAAARRWGDVGGSVAFRTPTLGAKHEWIYRGQVLPTDEKVTVQAVITAIDDQNRTMLANGHLIVDGRVIYQMVDFGIQLFVD